MSNKILLLDQSAERITCFTEVFSKDFAVFHESSSGLNIEKLKEERDYLAIVLNLNDGESTGFELIAKLSMPNNYLAPSVIALTNSESEQTILKCYELGVGLCISNTLSNEIICKKSANLINYKQQVNCLSSEEIKLNNLVTTTMMQSSFYGASLNLISELQFASSPAKMATYIFDFMQQFGITTSISFTAPNAHFDFDQLTFYCSPLEQQVFELLKDKGRLFEFGNRVMFNSPCVSLLIKNMPAKDSTDYGLFIDVFAKLVPSVDMSFKNLMNKQQLKSTQGQLIKAVEDIQKALLRSQQDKQILLDKLVMEIGLSFHEYEFTDQQEDFLSSLIENNVVRQTESAEQFLDISQQLSSLIDTLNSTEKGKELGYVELSNSYEVELF